MTVGELLVSFGGGSPNDRADRFRTMLGLPRRPWGGGLGRISLGSADYFLSERRAQIVIDRDAVS
jgi:hypothetical protein